MVMIALGACSDNHSVLRAHSFAEQENLKNSQMAQSLPTGHQGGIIVLARVSPSTETDFAQILLPLALSYETFVCKLSVALGVPLTDVRKVKKLPDILIRTTEDVIRLEQFDKLELRLKRQNFIVSTAQKLRNFGGKFANFAFYALLALCACFIVRTEFENQLLFRDLAVKVEELNGKILAIHSKTDELMNKVNKHENSPSGGRDLTDFERVLEQHWQSVENALKESDDLVQKKVEKLDKGVGMLAQRIKETKQLFQNGLKEFVEDFREKVTNCKEKDRY